MTNRNTAKNLGNLKFTSDAADKLLTDTGLADEGWTFKFDNARRRGGAAHFKNQTISMSRLLVPLWTEEQILNTLYHEVAHALVGYDHAHDDVWRAKCVELGGNGSVTHSNPVIDRTERLHCKNCGHTKDYYTRNKTRCPWCYSKDIEWSAAAPADVTNVPVVALANTTPVAKPMNGKCRCGCGQAAKRTYCPGHDARHVSRLVRLVRGNQMTVGEAQEELLSPALRAKFLNALHRA